MYQVIFYFDYVFKKTITFLFGCYCNSDFHCACATIDDPVSYIEMVKFANKDICQIYEENFVFIIKTC